jgi:hypothetical protein
MPWMSSGTGLDAHQNDAVIERLQPLGLVGIEHDLARGGTRRGGKPGGDDVARRFRIKRRMQQLVERDGSIRITASDFSISPSSAMSTAILRAALAVRFPVRVCSIQSLPPWMVNSMSCMSR